MIRFRCPTCGKSIKVSDDAAGKQGTCHGCQSRIDIPLHSDSELATTSSAAPAVNRVPCVFCGEYIAETAIKCKHCNEYQDGRSQQPQVAMAAPALQPSVNVNVSQHTNVITQSRHWSAFLAMLLSFIFPGLGQLYKGQFLRAVMWIMAIIVGYFAFIFPGIILQICCIIDAGVSSPNH